MVVSFRSSFSIEQLSAGFVREDRFYAQRRCRPSSRVDPIKLVDQIQRDVGITRLAFGLHFLCFHEFATCVRPASQALPLAWAPSAL